MNLSIITKMLNEGNMSLDCLSYLLNCRAECERLDYKEQLHIDNDKGLCDFTKDILAMKNVGGGYIVIGVEDKTRKPVGLANHLPYDGKMLRDKVKKCSGLDLEVDIVPHDLHVEPVKLRFNLVYVRGSKRSSKLKMPSIVSKDYFPKEAYGLRRGDIYSRRGDSTVRVQSAEELQEVTDAIEVHVNQDAFEASVNPSPFAIEHDTYRLLEKGFEHFVGRSTLKKTLESAVTQDPRIWIINVHGPGGVGKSALVNWLVYRFYEQRAFEAIIHLTAKETVLTQAGIRPHSRTLYSLENLLDHVLDDFQEKTSDDLEVKKNKVIEYLCAWKTLLVLDNMETVSDGRIISFVQSLPPQIQSKVLITSRQKTGGWELPVAVNEFDFEETKEFIDIKSKELGVDFPLDDETCHRVLVVSRGLPLAIQWMIGQYKILRRIHNVLVAVAKQDSPILEFSFGNIWKILSNDAKAILAIMSIFDQPPTAQEISIASAAPLESVEKSLESLVEVTLVTKNTQVSDGRLTYTALPITLAFARNQLTTMGELELECRRRLNLFNEQMELRESEVSKLRGIFLRYRIETDHEKRAVMLCMRGQSEASFGNDADAESYFQRARDLAPQSAYVHMMWAKFLLLRKQVGKALQLIEVGCNRANRRISSASYQTKAEILDEQRDRAGRRRHSRGPWSSISMIMSYATNMALL